MLSERSSSTAMNITRAHLHGFAKQPTASVQNTACTNHCKPCGLRFVRLHSVDVQRAELFGSAPLHKDNAKIYTKNESNSTYKHSSVANRFSTSLVGRGKKGVGCKLLLKSLAISRRVSLDLLQNTASTKHCALRLVQLRHASLKEGSIYKHRVVPADENHKTQSAEVFAQTSVFRNNALVAKRKTRKRHNNESSLLAHNVLSDNFVQQQKGYELCKTLFSTRPGYMSNKALRFSGAALCSTSRIAWLCLKVMENVKPIVETRKVRRGGNTYQVPFVLDKSRQEGMAIRWLIKSSVGRNVQSKAFNTHHTAKGNAFDVQQKKINLLSVAFIDSLKNTGQAIEKRNKAHQLALHNRAYIHYRWW